MTRGRRRWSATSSTRRRCARRLWPHGPRPCPRPHGAAPALQSAQRLPGGDQPDPGRGDAQPGRRRAGRRSATAGRREHRLRSTGRRATGSRTRRRRCSPTRPGQFGAAFGAVAELERQVLEAEGIEGVVLRYGWLYGPGTYYERGGSTGRRSDASGACRSSARAPAPSPSSTSTMRPRPPSPRSSAAPPASTTSSTTSRRRCASGSPSTPRRSAPSRRGASRSGSPASSPARTSPPRPWACAAPTNAKAKRELGWEPAHPSWRQGFRDALVKG